MKAFAMIVIAPLLVLAIGSVVYQIDYMIMSIIFPMANHEQIYFFALPLSVATTSGIVLYSWYGLPEGDK